MKRLFIFISFMTFALANTYAQTIENKKMSEVDSLAYDLGLSQSGGLRQYMSMELGVDEKYLDDFIRGMKDGSKDPDQAQIAYNKGLQIGGDIINMAKSLKEHVYGSASEKSVSTEMIVTGLVDGLKMPEGDDKNLRIVEADNRFDQKLDQLHEKMINEQYGDWKIKNEQWLDINKNKDGVVTLESGVQYKVIKAGRVKAYGRDHVVTCYYVGKLIDGTEFDSSKKEDGEPLEVDIDEEGVIPGFLEVLKIMPKNAVWEVYIPADFGYKNLEMDEIKPYSTLIFTIETK